jgi:thiol-disulfide isomerase/thioredoxin
MNRAFAAIVVSMAGLVGLQLVGCGSSSSMPLGVAAPPIQAAGWLQGTEPTPEELKGRVVVLDAFGYWCGPCRTAAPELVETYRRYAPQGVVFLGLTPDGEADVTEIREFLTDTNITWPIGYGAQPTLVAYGVQYFPTVIVIGGDGRIAWTSDQRGSLPVALDRALRVAGKAVGQGSP